MNTTPLEVAESYVGFRSRALRTNDFGAATGHNTKTWAGSFVEVCFRESGKDLVVDFSETASALAYCQMVGAVVKTPSPGDVVFYAFATDYEVSQMHVGIVSDVQNWKDRGQFTAIEGEMAPNASKKYNGLPDGVWHRTRYATEVAFFVSPDRIPGPVPLRKGAPTIDSSGILPLTRGTKIETIQKALSDVFGDRIRGVRKGIWDAPTGHAYGQWQRITNTDPQGVPDDVSLAQLGVVTGRFTV